jgi:hypothetical protein
MGEKGTKKALVVLLNLILLYTSVIRVSAESISINDLIESAALYDNQTITIEAEVIGEALNRGEYTWLNVNDGSNAMGVWIPSTQAEKLSKFGNYDTNGDTILIIGVFHRSCAEHGGDVDIHSDIITVTQYGSTVEHPLSTPKLIWAVSLLGTAAISGIFAYRSRLKKPLKTNVILTEEELS